MSENLPDLTQLYAQFVHEDGSWYRLWITVTLPKTEKGHRWHLHASYDKTGTIAPVPGTLWYAQPYGMSNWNFHIAEGAMRAFLEKAQERIEHGYRIEEGTIPETVSIFLSKGHSNAA